MDLKVLETQFIDFKQLYEAKHRVLEVQHQENKSLLIKILDRQERIEKRQAWMIGISTGVAFTTGFVAEKLWPWITGHPAKTP